MWHSTISASADCHWAKERQSDIYPGIGEPHGIGLHIITHCSKPKKYLNRIICRMSGSKTLTVLSVVLPAIQTTLTNKSVNSPGRVVFIKKEADFYRGV